MDSIRQQDGLSDFNKLFMQKNQLYHENKNSDDQASTIKNSVISSKDRYLENLAYHIRYSYQIS